MPEFWTNFPAVLAIGLLFGGWVLAAIVHQLASNWRQVRTSEHLAALKQTMVERGMTAEEIERVINAGSGGEKRAAQANAVRT